MLRYDRNTDWLQIWDDDKKWIMDIMQCNIIADLEAGYNPDGRAIQQQREDLQAYIKEYHAAMDQFVYMSDEETNKWCFYDLKKRGAIA